MATAANSSVWCVLQTHSDISRSAIDRAQLRGTFTSPESEVNDTDDESLMTRYAKGDPAAFELLYARHKQTSFRFFRRQLSNESALDCHQELWMKLIKSADRYQSSGKFAAMLYTIAHNVLTDYYRRNKKHYLVDSTVSLEELAPPMTTPDAESALSRERLRNRLINLVRKLPYTQKEAFILREDCGLSIKEIAQVTGSNEEGIKSRLRYALAKLKSGMQNYV